MYPQTNYYYQQPTQTQTAYNSTAQFQMMAQGLKGRPVSSFEEARAMTIDFDGSTFFFPDLANKRIYTKQINMDGTASLFVYELREQPIETTISNSANYVTREEFEKVIEELRAMNQSISQPAQPATAPAAATKSEQKVFNLF